MEDTEIVLQLFRREEQGLIQLQRKYGRLCHSIAGRILTDSRDVEECVSDAFLRIWNAIPPEQPRSLQAFICRVARNLALDRCSYNTAAQRSSALTNAFEELEPFLQGVQDDPESKIESADFCEFINRFLYTQPKNARIYFVRRYWFGETIREISHAFHISEGTIKSSLHRTRLRLQEAIRKENIVL